ncbi:hypothetical protein FRC03_003346 [Tulasnella sp. 419]|nr:hypothetical protein FRC02_012373 [Tulasnella sp. 418]KAG8963145.1 hypothetical protein FRC03_003346 [Tulasnella sp. 419]
MLPFSYLEPPFEFPAGSRHIYNTQPRPYRSLPTTTKSQSTLETLIFLIRMVMEESRVDSFSHAEVFYCLNQKWPHAFGITEQRYHLAPIQQALNSSGEFLLYQDGRWRLNHTVRQIGPSLSDPIRTNGDNSTDDESLVESEHDAGTYDSLYEQGETSRTKTYKREGSVCSIASESNSTIITGDSDTMDSNTPVTSLASNTPPYSPSTTYRSPQSPASNISDSPYTNPQHEIAYPFENYKPLHSISNSTYKVVGSWIHFSFDPDDVWHDIDELQRQNQNRMSSSAQRRDSNSSLTEPDQSQMMNLEDMLHLDALIE